MVEHEHGDNTLDIIPNTEGLSLEAKRVADLERQAPLRVEIDASVRLKVLDQCGMTCTFCHNEGTPVSADNRRKTELPFVSSGPSGRVSIFSETNGVNFISDTVQPGDELADAMNLIADTIPTNEVHLTGGEPTLHPNIVSVVSQLVGLGHQVKMTSNGERFYAVANDLKHAGLDKVVFSIFGTTPEELAEVQGGKYNNTKFGAIKLHALDKSIEAAVQNGIKTAANIVMPDSSHRDRVLRVLDKYGSACQLRILNSLAEGSASYNAVYELLADLGAKPVLRNITAGASGMSTTYELPDGRKVAFKQIRKSYLDGACDTCDLKDDGCDEGYYGVRMYKDNTGGYRIGVCIQRMDLTTPLQQFVEGELPEAIMSHRAAEYAQITRLTSTVD